MSTTFSGLVNPDENSTLQEVGSYASATIEYSSMVVSSLLQRGGRSLKKGASVAISPVVSCALVLKRGADEAVAPLKKLSGSAKKASAPLVWTVGQLASAIRRGIPVHLDRESIVRLEEGLARIEMRLAHLEENGIAVAAGGERSMQRQELSQDKKALLRAILDTTKDVIEKEKKKS